LSAVVSNLTGVSEQSRELYRFELDPEVHDWLDSLNDSDFKRLDEVSGMLAEKGTGLGGPWSDHLAARCGNFASGFTRCWSG
jgi:hypothetical protein